LPPENQTQYVEESLAARSASLSEIPAHRQTLVGIQRSGQDINQSPEDLSHDRTATCFPSHETPQLTRITAE
jgi:hypothetical protein